MTGSCSKFELFFYLSCCVWKVNFGFQPPNVSLNWVYRTSIQTPFTFNCYVHSNDHKA